MIPPCFSAYRTLIPLLDEVTEWSLLRKWSLSEVYRITLKHGETRIIKWGGKEMAGEAAIYRQLVNPLKIKAPHIFDFFETDASAVMVMEDAGASNLEQQPDPEHFLEAARELARLRARASNQLHTQVPDSIIRSYTVSAADFLSLLDDLLRSSHLLPDKSVLIRLQDQLPRDLNILYQTVPLTLVHHDYHAKNLLIQGDGILPIDWSIAYLSPHLGDLYSLISEANVWGKGTPSREAILAAFLEETGSTICMEQLLWQVRVGGVCWLMKTLQWLAYGGTDTIPGSEAWIPDLMKDLEQLLIASRGQ